jgi:hypothetical protein
MYARRVTAQKIKAYLHSDETAAALHCTSSVAGLEPSTSKSDTMTAAPGCQKSELLLQKLVSKTIPIKLCDKLLLNLTRVRWLYFEISGYHSIERAQLRR